MNDYNPVVYGVGLAALVVLGVWLAAFAPCGCVSWMAVKDVPSRCLGKP